MYKLYNEDDVASTWAWVVRAKKLLETIPEDRPLDRMSLKHQLEDFYEQLEAYEQYGRVRYGSTEET